MADSLQERSRRILGVLEDLSRETDRFEAEAGLHCRAGCGDCCNNPEVEATVGEMLPLAFEILGRGAAQAEHWHGQAEAGEGKRCVFYAANSTDPSLGRCSVYALRPGLCRLFAFAAVRDKEGKPRLAACHWHKSETPEVTAAAQEGVASGRLTAPFFVEWQTRLDEVSELASLTEKFPINTALARALEKASLAGL
ncbi:MAG TPA: YkgJ family cysteine cluster protein [Bdellovibrionota bacterium]|nr:YkgJ family cysteine cluster protein [Bdellovibrionota bacterium]